MNRSKRITILLCVLVVACAATFGMMHYEQRKEKIQAKDQVILEIPPEDVQTLSWEYEDESLSFHRDEDGSWRWDEDDAFPVDEDAMGNLLDWFSSLGTTFVIEDVEDYGQYGLSEPECTITLTTQEESYTVTLGAFSQMDSQRYLSIDDGNAYLVGEDPMDDFRITIRSLIHNDEVPDLTDVTGLEFSGAESYRVSYEEDSGKSYSSDDVYFTGNQALDTTRVKSYLQTLEDLSLTNYATYNATQEELSSFGMETPELTISVNYKPESEDDREDEAEGVFTLHVSRDPEAVKEAAQKAADSADTEDTEDAEESEIPCYVRVGDSPIVYSVTETEYDSLAKAAYNDLRHQEAFWADFDDVTQVDVTLDGASYCLTTTPVTDESEESEDTEETQEEKKDDDEETHWYYNGEEIQMDDFRSAVTNLTADSFTDEKATGKEEIRLTLHLENETFPEVEIRLYRYDGSHCLAVVDGTPTALVKRVYAVDLIEAVNAIVLN